MGNVILSTPELAQQPEPAQPKKQTWGLLTLLTLGYVWYDALSPEARKGDIDSDWDWTIINPSEDEQLSQTIEKQKKLIQKELAPFFDNPAMISKSDIHLFVKNLNEVYPEYAIDPEKDLLEEIRSVKSQMLKRGEEGFRNGVGAYAAYSPRLMNTARKVAGLAPKDISYEREMLSYFRFFYR